MDLDKFLAAPLPSRSSTIAVPELAAFFEKDEKAEWVVRGMTATELARTKEAHSNSDLLKQVAEKLATGDKASALKDVLGVGSDEVPEDISERIERLAIASVSPALGDEKRDIAVKLAESFPVTFYKLTNEILNLTGQGADLGKLKRYGRTAK